MSRPRPRPRAPRWILAVVASLAVSASVPAPAAPPAAPAWQELTPLAGAIAVLDLLETPTGALLAGSYPNGTVFRSSDGGASWTAVLIPPGAYRVQSLERDAQGRIYAGTYPGGDVWLSDDDGLSWRLGGEIPGATEVRDLLAARDGTIYAATAPLGRVYRSYDRAGSWEPTTAFNARTVTYSLNEGPDATIYAGPRVTLGANFPRTTDHGVTWDQSGETPSNSWVAIESLHLRDDGVHFFGAWLHGAEKTPGVYRSDDGGLTWSLTSEIAGVTDVWRLVATPDGALYAALGVLPSTPIYRTLDGGARWEPVGDLPGVREGYGLLRTSSGDLILGTAPDGRIFRMRPTAAVCLSLAAGDLDLLHGVCPEAATDPTLRDFIEGDIGQLSGDTDLGTVTCLADDYPAEQVAEAGADPNPGSSFFYLARAAGDPDYGLSSRGGPRLPSGGDCP